MGLGAMKKDISIIIPVWNPGKFFRPCLDSFIAQENIGSCQMILVDDCSTDKSWKVIEEYSRKYSFIEPYRLDENSGAAVARNFGISKATGEYIFFFDDDDSIGVPSCMMVSGAIGYSADYPIDSGYLWRLLDAAKHLDADITYGGKVAGIQHSVRNKFGNITVKSSKTMLARNIEDAVSHASLRDNANGALFRSSFVKKHNLSYPPELLRDNDLVFSFRALGCAEKIGFAADTGFLYRIHSKNTCNAKMDKNFARKQIQLINLICDYYLAAESWAKDTAIILHNYYMRHRPNQMFLCAKLRKSGITKDDMKKNSFLCINKNCDKCEVLQSSKRLKYIKETLREISPSFAEREFGG
jgi:glycosyltransferase involved in cell wall biosynthesis